MADEYDYIAVKLDIDHPATENELIRLLLASKELIGVIDEFFFEQHVNTPVMAGIW